MSPLIDDEYVRAPARRILAHLQEERTFGRPTVGIYCCYAPLELIWAAGCVPVGLCATSRYPITAAETVLPAGLCPLIKSSFGFIMTETCPFYRISDVVVAETTCDGKKKMFELIADRKPTLVLELPQTPDEPASFERWLESVRRMKRFLESAFDRQVTDQVLEETLRLANRRRSLIREIAAYARFDPPLIGWDELKEITALAGIFHGHDVIDLLRRALVRLEKRRRNGPVDRMAGAPRVMVTGCPIGGDAEKVFQVIEECGGAVVAQEACSGLKPLWTDVEEETGDPLAAIARRYFELPCSCMTPNTRRLEYIDRLIEVYRPDAVIDVILSGCHAYNVESHLVKTHVAARHALPFLKIETDYSEGDLGRLQTRIGALLEIAGTEKQEVRP